MEINAKVQIKEIGPVEAGKLLANQVEDQRKLRMSWVAQLSKDMTDNRFKCSPDAITVVCGKLANGQNRLNAIIQSGTTQKFLYLETTDETLFDIIDSGKSRTVGDVLHGHSFINSNQVASISRMSMMYENELLTPLGSTAYKKNNGGYEALITRQDLIDFARINSKVILEAIDFIGPIYKQTKLLYKSVAGTLYISVAKNKRGAVREFLEGVYLGKSGNQVIQIFRNRLIGETRKKSSMSSSYQLGLSIKSFNAFYSNMPVSPLRISEGEKFPRIC